MSQDGITQIEEPNNMLELFFEQILEEIEITIFRGIVYGKQIKEKYKAHETNEVFVLAKSGVCYEEYMINNYEMDLPIKVS